MKITQEQLEKDILEWITGFVEVPHPALGGFPPCPYARKARLDNAYEVRVGRDMCGDMMDIVRHGMNGKDVIAVAYDPEKYERERFAQDIEFCNEVYLLSNDLLALEDHPDDPEIVNGVCMNQGKYALVLVQGLTDLNKKAKIVARKGFYDIWPEEYLSFLFRHREDPRK